MKTMTPTLAPNAWAPARAPRFVYHPSFEAAGADQELGEPPADGAEAAFMTDEVTRAWARHMHYAAWRAATASRAREATRWRRRYYTCRNRIILGNRNLTFRAVRKWRPDGPFADDLAGECQIVLIKLVASFNPWLPIRFSTYAFTCLLRALSRLSQRQAADRLSRCLPLDAVAGGGPTYLTAEEPGRSMPTAIDSFLQPGHTLLTPREKLVLIRRYRCDDHRIQTLEEVGHDLGLSKERVRQLQNAAIGKLRQALCGEPSCS